MEDLAVGGWQVTGITTFQTGFPYTIRWERYPERERQPVYAREYCAGLQYQKQSDCAVPADQYGLLHSTRRSGRTETSDGTPCASRALITGILGVGKQFDFTERLRFQIKADAFNAFNHHQYGGDVGGLLVAGSGGNAAIDNNVNDSKFGLITQSSKSREFQFSGKVTF